MDSSPQPIISDQVIVNGATTLLTLTAGGILRWTDRGQRCLTVEKEVLGFVIEGSKIRVKTIIDNGDGICCAGNSGALVRKDFVFQPLTEDSQRVLCNRLRDYLDSLGRPKRLLVFVNPFGGKRSASKIFFDTVKPLLEDADVQITLQETKHQLHAKEVTSTLDISKYDGIVCVSGDGILVEVVNGLLAREDWRDAIKLPLGMVPAGTSNGMAKSLLDSVGEPCKASNAVLAIIRGHKCSLDVATILQGETKFFSVLMLSWGLVADIDIESEKYRWMGSARIDFYAVQRIFHLRHYNGCISFVPAPGFETYGVPTSYNAESTSKQEQPLKTQHGYQGPDVNLVNLDWRMISGPFVSIWLHNVPWGGEDVMAAPDAKFSDGYLDLILIQQCPKLSLLALMTALNNGDHVKSPYVIYLKVKAFILEPGPRTDDPTKGGIIDVDGEVLARGNGSYKCDQKSLMVYDKLHMMVDQGLATLFSPV
ncbi:sphingosine kinase 1 isoform X1 [Ricinus communis]|uniref:sphingosine kinase n=2 Tax=Ricinus communis TaxID=3988 RepID=B9SFA5_RICCO|nr:sphingosine kinase 1 isoform X1 [Ricinus communis]EEF37693.1 Sphingosine kinase, putative [Ricinus communis]|eukprot:XP_002524674.1 sphingosine kinase 1 isoform X1 [Ricinus communis]